jgi:hypothetical protein
MTKEDEWYKNRILWKATKNNLFDYDCIEFSELLKEQQEFIKKLIPDNAIPVIVFWKDFDTWTLLCTQMLISYYDDKLQIVPKDKLNQRKTLYIEKDGKEIENYQKKEAKWLYMTDTKQYIWLPTSKSLWSFWPILLTLSSLAIRK